jgi:hypothetical protein
VVIDVSAIGKVQFFMRNPEAFAVADIHVPENRRALDSAKVKEIAGSIKQLGLLSPIGIRRHGDAPVELVWGAHRLAATVSLGLRTISAISVDALGWDRGHCEDGDIDDFVKMAEISENLHRSDLTTQERSEHFATWVELLERTRPISGAEQPNSGKPGPKPSQAVAEVSRATGLSTKTIKQAIASTKVSPKVKAASDDAGLTSRQRLAISRLPETDQLEAVTRMGRTKNRASPKLPNQQLGVMSNSLVTTPSDGQATLSGALEWFEHIREPIDTEAGIAALSDVEKVSLFEKVVRLQLWCEKIKPIEVG